MMMSGMRMSSCRRLLSIGRPNSQLDKANLQRIQCAISALSPTTTSPTIASFSTAAASSPSKPPSGARISKLNGRGSAEKHLLNSVPRAHSWTLTRHQIKKHLHPRFQWRIAPWIGSERETDYHDGFTDEDAKGGEEEPKVQTEKSTDDSDTQHQSVKFKRHKILSPSEQRHLWLLEHSHPKIKHPERDTSAKMHPKPPPKPKSAFRRIVELLLSGGFISYAAYFYYTHLETIPIINRQHFIGLTPQMELAIGRYILEKSLEDQKVISNLADERVRLVTKVGKRIAAAANKPEWEWEFYVVESPLVNAMCYPGGSIVVYTGLLDMLYQRELEYREKMHAAKLQPIVMVAEPTRHSPAHQSFLDRVKTSLTPSSNPHDHTIIPAEVWPWQDFDTLPPPESFWSGLLSGLKGWLGFGEELSEIAVVHPVKSDYSGPSKQHHSHEIDSRGLKIDRDLLSNQLAVVLGHEVGHAIARHSGEKLSWYLPLSFLNLVNSKSPILNYLYELLFNLPFSRAEESEADQIGLHLMARACYHPGASGAFWYGFSGLKHGQHYFGTHPSDDQRSQNARKWYQQAKQEMRRCCQ